MAIIDHIPSRATDLRANPVRPTLMQRLAVWKSRRALARLDVRALEDIGLTREAAEREAQKGVWDVPQTWLDR